ncbi:hypothetical protein [Desulfonatronovibrio hydrogenovorans]|uniref:hypothetical protein n=1 Tax=Desulfonatronovibrio hydrogenovorans TaxID=53245 RepID=UPI000490B413|nr:hypothetical protein [Desulfonatronovibrio hydrogenovorans]
MAFISDLKLLRPSFYYLILAGFVLAVIYLTGIQPKAKEKDILRAEILNIKAILEEHGALYPVYQQLQMELEASQDYLPVSFGPLEAWHVEDIDGAIAAIKQVIHDSGLEEVRLTPIPKSLERGGGKFAAQVELSGQLDDLRKFILELVEVPFFGGYETLEIQKRAEGMRYVMKLWITMS